MQRRGSLSISTNAIVILIIAVIMLGLIIGLVTRGFSSVERKFLEQIEEAEPEAPTPSTANPITVSVNSKIASRGELVGFKINILNTGSANLPEVMPGLNCLGTSPVQATDSEQSFHKELAVNEVASYTYFFEVSDTIGGGAYLCQIRAVDTGGTAIAGITPAEIRITIED